MRDSYRLFPQSIRKPFDWARFLISSRRRVFPIPASPDMKTVLPLPAEASFRCSCISLSSSRLPMISRWKSRLVVHPPTFRIGCHTKYVAFSQASSIILRNSEINHSFTLSTLQDHSALHPLSLVSLSGSFSRRFPWHNLAVLSPCQGRLWLSTSCQIQIGSLPIHFELQLP